jgi:hypothetical protein
MGRQFDNEYDDMWYHRYDMKCRRYVNYNGKLDSDRNNYMKVYWFMFFLYKLGVWQ